MNHLPVSIRRTLRRLARRLAIGQFLEVWPRGAIASLLVAGLIALVCRMFFPTAANALAWLWLAPIVTSLPALWMCISRRYHPTEVVAIADVLSGGQGTLLTVLETGDSAWTDAAVLKNVSNLALPRLRPLRQLWLLLPGAAFLAAALLMPQRTSSAAGNAVLANDIAANLKNTLAELKKESLVTPDEGKKLEEEIEHVRKAALERVDSSSWEASDAVRDKMASMVSEKRDAMKWAQESLARYAAAEAGGSKTDAPADEIAKAIDKLAQAGLLADAPGELQKLLGGQYAVAGGKVQLPGDAASLRKLSELLSAYLAKRNEGLRQLASGGKDSGRFDLSEYPEFSYDRRPDGDGDPGSGGINRGRADAELTWGKETASFDRFKSVALPPGAVRSPDDWSPVAVLPGAPKASPESSAAALAREYGKTPGQAAWRRTLAPRHQSAVKKYFGGKEPQTNPDEK